MTDGRIVLIGEKVRRRPQKRADYLLRYTRDFVIAVVEAKSAYKTPSDGLQQAKEYAAILDLKFAYATNGHGMVEFDFLTGQERQLETFPAPDELWKRLGAEENLKGATATDQLLTPYNHLSGKSPRYYQDIAIHRTVRAILRNKPRILLTMATGTGKRRRVSDLLEAVAGTLEPDRRISPSQNPLPRRPQHFDRRSQG